MTSQTLRPTFLDFLATIVCGLQALAFSQLAIIAATLLNTSSVVCAWANDLSFRVVGIIPFCEEIVLDFDQSMLRMELAQQGDRSDVIQTYCLRSIIEINNFLTDGVLARLW